MVITRVVTRLKRLGPGIGGRFVKHTRKAKKLYLRLMKVMKGRALKQTRCQLPKISEKVIADGQVVQAELGLSQEQSSSVKGLSRRLGE